MSTKKRKEPTSGHEEVKPRVLAAPGLMIVAIAAPAPGPASIPGPAPAPALAPIPVPSQFPAPAPIPVPSQVPAPGPIPVPSQVPAQAQTKALLPALLPVPMPAQARGQAQLQAPQTIEDLFMTPGIRSRLIADHATYLEFRSTIEPNRITRDRLFALYAATRFTKPRQVLGFLEQHLPKRIITSIRHARYYGEIGKVLIETDFGQLPVDTAEVWAQPHHVPSYATIQSTLDTIRVGHQSFRKVDHVRSSLHPSLLVESKISKLLAISPGAHHARKALPREIFQDFASLVRSKLVVVDAYALELLQEFDALVEEQAANVQNGTSVHVAWIELRHMACRMVGDLIVTGHFPTNEPATYYSSETMEAEAAASIHSVAHPYC